MKKLSKVMLFVLVLLLAMQGVWAQGTKEAAVQDKTIRIFGAFRGEEAARFDEIIRIFNEKSGYTAVYEGSPEFETQILVQAEAGTPPDIAALPQPGLMHKFAAQGYLKPLS
ncbi:MAG: extracellular solute-binding protein, partial [Sphaerochaeta sp.]|nr:extracellular solute-binding protein [Sphaerochaeta sp.]